MTLSSRPGHDGPRLERDRVDAAPATVDGPQPDDREDLPVEGHREPGAGLGVRDGQPAPPAAP